MNMSLLLPSTTVRHRRPTVQEVVRDFDAFNKTVDEVSEEKRATGGIRELLSKSASCFSLPSYFHFHVTRKILRFSRKS